MTNEKKSNMSDEQKLYPQLIYRINSILSDIKSDLEKDYKKGGPFIAPSVLDPDTRTFNWLMVSNEKWKFSSTAERKSIENHINSSWKQFEKEFIHGKEMKTVSDAIDIIRDSANKDEDYHFALLSIYQFYPNNPKKYIDGIIYRNIARRAKERNGKNHRIDYAQVTLRCEEKDKKTYILYPWVEINFFDNEGAQEGKYSCQEFNPSDPEKKITKGYPADDNPDVDRPEEIKPLESELDYKKYGWGKFTPATLRTNHFHKNYFVPFFVKDEGFNPKEFYKLSPEYLSQRKYIYVIPLYDALYGEYGNLCAVLQIPFVNTTERDKFNEVKNILINRLPFLVNEIKNAAFFEILKQPIEGDNLLEHFIKYLSMLQDWEFVRVFQIKNSDEVLLDYCYRRREKGEEKGKWKRCERNYKECEEACSIKVNNDGILEDKELSKKLIEDKKKHIACDETTFGKGSMHKALLEDIFTERYIPELDEYDKSKCENKIVIYEYPSYTIIPDDEPEEHKLGLFYERQQIDLLRQLAIKRKVILETIRHGTKAATNAIISRNFSHHIGSHVIPRATVEKIEEKIKVFHSSIPDKDLLKIINTLKTRLDTYNQKKSDFMAEIATEPLATTKSMYFYKDIIVPLITNTLLIGNICENEGLGYNVPSECRIKIRFFFGKDKEELIAKFSQDTDANHYPYISGELKGDGSYCSLDNPEEIRKENASNINDDGDKEIAVPGPLGEFALYSFLENFIRNAAKHNIKEWKDAKNLEVNIKVSEIMDVDPNDLFYKDGDQNEFYSVEICDNVTDPNKQGFKVKENGKEVEKNLCEFINHQIRQPIINDDGSLRKGSWGIAEMKIMATLLRGSDCFEKMGENLRTIKTDDKLIYEFKVMKPKKIAIISRDTTKTSKYESQEFKNKGIWLFNGINDFFERLKNGRSRASFEFAFLDKDTFEELKNYKNEHNSEYKRHLAILPFRVIVEGYNGSMEEIYKIIPGATGINNTLFNNSATPQYLISSTWKEWIKYLKERICGGTEACLLLYLEQDNCEEPTRSYEISTSNINNFHVIPSGSAVLPCKHKESKLLLFDRHFRAFHYVKEKEKIKFHEAIDKNNSDFIHIFSPPFVDSQISEEFFYTLFEAGLLRILIIDERIAEKAYDDINWNEPSYAQKAYCGKQRIHAAMGGGIYICTHLSVFHGEEIPIHPNIGNSPLVSVRVKLNMKNKEDLDYSKEPTVIMVLNQKEEILKPDAVIIHQGILENNELVGIREDQFGDFLEKIKEKYPYVVVDSGRGIPHKLHELAKFMPFSLLDDYIGRERIAKYNIVKILMSLSRRTNSE